MVDFKFNMQAMQAVSHEKHKACSMRLGASDSRLRSFMKFISSEHSDNGYIFRKSPLGENDRCKYGTLYLVL